MSWPEVRYLLCFGLLTFAVFYLTNRMFGDE